MPEEKKRVTAIVYEGELGVCSCRPFGVFKRHVPYRLRDADYEPPTGNPRITESEAEALIESHTVKATAFVRDAKGNVLHNTDGTPKVREERHCPFRLVELDEEVKTNG